MLMKAYFFVTFLSFFLSYASKIRKKDLPCQANQHPSRRTWSEESPSTHQWTIASRLWFGRFAEFQAEPAHENMYHVNKLYIVNVLSSKDFGLH